MRWPLRFFCSNAPYIELQLLWWKHNNDTGKPYCILQIHPLCERTKTQRRTKVCLMMCITCTAVGKKARLVTQWINQACSYYWVILGWCHQLVSRKFSWINNLLERFRVNLKTFLDLGMPDQYWQTVAKEMWRWFYYHTVWFMCYGLQNSILRLTLRPPKLYLLLVKMHMWLI